MGYVNYAQLFNSEENIARAIMIVLKKRGMKLNLKDFSLREECKSYKKKNSITFWHEVCHAITNQEKCHQDTYEKYIERLHKKFTRSFNLIQIELNKILNGNFGEKINQKDGNSSESRGKLTESERLNGEGTVEGSEDCSRSENSDGMTGEESYEKLKTKPWDNVEDYPDQNTWKKITPFFRGNFKMTKEDLETLLPGGWLNDLVISAFIRSLENDAEVDPYVFDIMFMTKLMSKTAFDGKIDWGIVDGIENFNVWIIPYNRAVHWSLIVVIISEKIILNLDSLNLYLPAKTLDRIVWYIEKVMAKKQEIFSWSEWCVYEPSDIPQQNDGYNCGVHLCIWSYIICKRANHPFDNLDMERIRKWIFHTIYSNDIRQKRQLRKKSNKYIIYDKAEKFVSRPLKRITSPPLEMTTLDFCATLLDKYAKKFK